MKTLTLDEIRDVLPELEELRPIFDHLVARSEPDPRRTWSGSGRLGTVGSRLVPDQAVRTDVLERLATTEAKRLADVYAWTARALTAMASRDRAAAAEALLGAAALEEVGDRPDRAAAYASAAYLASRGEKDQRAAALALRRWARASKALGTLAEALNRYARSHLLARGMRDAQGAAEAAIGAGNVLEEQGRWADAAEWYRRALAALDDVGGPAPERWHALLNLHIVMRSSGAIEESLPLLESAAWAAADSDPDGAAPLIANARGQLEMARAAFAAAEKHFQNALDGKAGTRAHVSFRLNLAEALLAQDRTLDAVEHVREAEREAIGASLVPKLPEVYRLLGRILSAEGDTDAFVVFERALEIIRERGLPTLEEALTLQAYAESEARRGETEAARQLQQEAVERFAALGMAHMRSTWADVYGPGPEESAPVENGSTHEDHER